MEAANLMIFGIFVFVLIFITFVIVYWHKYFPSYAGTIKQSLAKAIQVILILFQYQDSTLSYFTLG